ncbi:YD repeat-containing protein [Paenibacillus endophyticus]|uniref:YD repeat-containing protein n=1 Tax=Paenibacillus endophyticus TaxID=1294268 RepID=A0A7W5C7F1_9BACL|nr:RHS repeat domain-containing protein [Paenibacillus endophyticus]MBB3152555.1 YD repeat-containing protein [Paenibacillus endophyticus]
MNKKRLKWTSIVSVVLLLCIAVSWKVSALEYLYDDLNRLISAKEESGQTTHYEYDATGNLLSVAKTDGGATVVSSTYGVSDGWLPYFTSGVTADYQLGEQALPMLSQQPADTESGNNAQVAAPMAVQQISAQAAAPGGANVYKDIEVAGSGTYEIKGSAMAQSLNNAAAQVIVNYYDEQGALLSHDTVINLQAVSDYTSFEQSLIMPSGAAKARIHLQLLLLEADSAGEAGFTNIQFISAQTP